MKRLAIAAGLISALLCSPRGASALPVDTGAVTLAHDGAPRVDVFFRGGGRRFAGRRFVGRGHGYGGRRSGYGYGRRRLGIAAGVAGAAVVGGAVAAGAASGCRRVYNPNTGVYVTNC